MACRRWSALPHGILIRSVQLAQRRGQGLFCSMISFASLSRRFLLLAGLLVSALQAQAVENGQAAPDFSLTDINGTSHKLSDYKGRIVVLEWVNPECPFVKHHYAKTGNLPALQKAARADGVVWLLINSGHPGAQGDFDAAKVVAWTDKTGASYDAYFRDQDGKVGHLYEAKTTPHLFVISAEGVLVYQGAIDSYRGFNAEDTGKASNYVREAIAALKAGRTPETALKPPYGCTVKY